MNKIIIKNIAPLLALLIFVLGNGLFSTFLTNELALKHTSPLLIGMMTTSLYAGLVVGSFKIEQFIHRVTHIRAYAAFANIIVIIPLLHMVISDVYFWLLLRFICGIATAGVFIVIESWLLNQSTARSRGQILSLYMITFYASQSAGQLLLKLNNHQGILIYVIISILTSLSVLPMATTKATLPTFSEPSTLNPNEIYKKCASGLFGSLFGGLILGTLYGLYPLFLINHLESQSNVANNMATLIFGGMLLQYPIGKLSDIIERRLVLLGVCAASCLILVLMVLTLSQHFVFLFLTLLLGGCTFTIYPLSISYACDNLDNKDITGGIQTLLLAYSIGAMSGPLIASLFMSYLNWGLFIYLIICSISLIILLSWRRTVSEASPQEDHFITLTQNTPIMMEIDPRADETIENTLPS